MIDDYYTLLTKQTCCANRSSLLCGAGDADLSGAQLPPRDVGLAIQVADASTAVVGLVSLTTASSLRCSTDGAIIAAGCFDDGAA